MDELKTFLEAFQGLADIPDEELTDDVMEVMMESVAQNFSPALVNQSINQIVQNLEAQGLSKAEAVAAVESLKATLKEMMYGEKQYVGNKKKLIDTLTDKLFSLFDSAVNKYHSFAIELPMTIDEGAKVPTYAHETDAAADMYAMEELTIPAHFSSVPVKTGVHIQLPEGWVAMLFPRSSIGAKTGLRLSNSVGIIDSGYRGEIRALYDNTSNEPYTIHKGDRIAQLLVMPSYRFQAKIVDSLDDSDRGEGGFGSTGT